MRASHTRIAPILQIFLGALAGVAAVATAGAVYQAVATARDHRRLPRPGALVRVGRNRLHVERHGTGSPTVILEAGELGTSATWAWVRDELALTTRVLTYDRAGLGWSHDGREPHDALHAVEELRALLDYRRAQVDFERVQEIPSTGNGGPGLTSIQPGTGGAPRAVVGTGFGGGGNFTGN